jgi:hypothetical protein
MFAARSCLAQNYERGLLTLQVTSDRSPALLAGHSK